MSNRMMGEALDTIRRAADRFENELRGASRFVRDWCERVATR